MKSLVTVLSFSLLWFSSFAQTVSYKTENNIPYREKSKDRYMNERCVLDLYYPETKDFATVVWFHGGGLVGGEKYIPEGLKNQGFAVAAVNYRLSPKAAHPTYIDDAAASAAWVLKHIKEFGGDPSKVFVAGHSAGGYLALMVGLDEQYLKKSNAEVSDIKGFFPISGQTITHNAIRGELKRPENVPYADEFAPLNHVKSNTPPFILITGGRDLDFDARYVENQYLYESLISVGNKNTEIYEINGFDHNQVVAPASILISRKIKEMLK